MGLHFCNWFDHSSVELHLYKYVCIKIKFKYARVFVGELFKSCTLNNCVNSLWEDLHVVKRADNTNP